MLKNTLIASVLVVCLVLVGQASAAIIGPNLITNPGAEASGTAVDPPWATVNGAWTVLDIGPGSGYEHSGSRSFQGIDGDAVSSFARTGTLAVDSTKQYQFEMWYINLSPYNNTTYGTSSFQLASDLGGNGPWEDLPANNPPPVPPAFVHYVKTIGPAGSGSDWNFLVGQTSVWVTIYSGGVASGGGGIGRIIVDDLVFAQTDWVVPEPMTLTVLGLGGLAVLVRRRR